MPSPLGRPLVLALALLATGCPKATPPAPAGEDLPGPEELAKDYVAYSVSPLGLRQLQFKVLAPKGWREEPLLLDQATLLFDDVAFVPLARFVSPHAGAPAVIEVSYLRLRREVDLGDFVEDYLRAQDMEVVSSQAARFNGEPVVDAVVTEGGRQGRLAFRKAGPIVFLVTGSAAQPDFASYARSFGAALVSLALPEEPRETFAEKVSTFEVSRELGLKIRKPQSWLAAPVTGAPEGCGGLDVTLKEDQAVRAILRLRWAEQGKARPEIAQGLAEATWKEFQAAGVHSVDFLGHARLSDDGAEAAPEATKIPADSAGQVGLWSGTVANHRVLMRAVTLEGARGTCVVTLLGPAREENAELWAAGAQLFSLVSKDVAAWLSAR